MIHSKLISMRESQGKVVKKEILFQNCSDGPKIQNSMQVG